MLFISHMSFMCCKRNHQIQVRFLELHFLHSGWSSKMKSMQKYMYRTEEFFSLKYFKLNLSIWCEYPSCIRKFLSVIIPCCSCCIPDRWSLYLFRTVHHFYPFSWCYFFSASLLFQSQPVKFLLTATEVFPSSTFISHVVETISSSAAIIWNGILHISNSFISFQTPRTSVSLSLG